DIIAGSDIVNMEQLLKRLEEKEKDAVLMLKKGDETSLFYFSGGRLSDGYFENTIGIEEESHVQDQLLIYTYSASEADPVAITLFYDLNISPACDLNGILETAFEGIDKPSVSRPLLISMRGEEKVDHILDKEVFTLGRDTKCDWVAQDVAISREHAIIRQCTDGFYIEDQESRNGTYINKEKITRQRLSNGDEIQMGPYHFIFLEDAARHNIAPPVSAAPERNDPSAAGRKDIRQDVPEKRGVPKKWGLEVISGNMAGDFFELASKSHSLGRGKVDIRIKDLQTSRHHADIKWTDEGFIVSDRKSANGVFVNDEKVETKQLSADDIIQVGETRLRVVCKE
ncbi:MAG: FHA domain-containing protein, partial [Nitrospiria bacterium]